MRLSRKKLAVLREREEYKFNLQKILFKEQLDFVEDSSPFKTAVCSRRSGKTIACAADLVNTATNNPKVVCLYITLSRSNAKKIIWRDIQAFNEQYNLRGKEDLVELSMRFPNGSIIYLSGAKDISSIQKFRGLAIKLCYIDEIQAFRQYVEELIDDVVSPALMDHNGSLCLIGTPGPIPSGFFYNCSVTNDAWSKHGWTFFDNPHIALKSGKTHKELIDRELARRGVGRDNPSIQREWFGQWVLDVESLVIKYQESVNHYDNLPKANYTYIMGIDIGFDDADAIAILAWSNDSPITYLIEELVVSKQGLTELVKQIEYLSNKYKVSKMVIDQAGLGKKLAEEIRRQHHLPLIGADKSRKMEGLAFLDDALRSGRFKAKKDSRFAQDSYLVEIDYDKSTPDKLAISNRFHSDIIDAVLYAFKESPAFSYQSPIVKPVYGTAKWFSEEEKLMEEWEEELLLKESDPWLGEF